MPNVGSKAESRGATARGTVQLLIARVLFMAAGYVITVVLARGLGPPAYGMYGFIMALLLWLEVSGGFGIHQATTKLIPSAEDPDLIAQTASALLLTVSFVLFGIGWFAAPLVAEVFQVEEGIRLFRLAILDLPLNGLYLAYQGILLGHRRFAALALTLIVYSLTKLLGILILLVMGLSVEGALIVNVLATLGALLFIFTRYRTPIRFATAEARRAIVAIAARLGVFVIMMQLLLATHLWLLKRLSGASEEVVGYYLAALNIANLPRLVPLALTGVVLVSIAWALAKDDRALATHYIQSAVRFILVVLTPACVLGVLHATPIMVLIYSDAYSAGGIYLAFLLTALGLFTLFETLMHSLIGAGKHYQVTGALLALVPLAVIFNVTLIARLGPQGAAASLVLTMIVALGIALTLAYRTFGVPLKWLPLVRVLCATGVVALLGELFETSGLWLLIELGFLMMVYLVALAGLGELGPQDLKLLVVWKRS